MSNVKFLTKEWLIATALSVSLIIGFISNNHGAFFDKDIKAVVLGNNVSLTCLSNNITLSWKHKNESIQLPKERFSVRLTSDKIDGNTVYIHTLNIINVQLSDEGTYLCKPEETLNNVGHIFYVQPYINPIIISSTDTKVKKEVKQDIIIFCLVEAFPLNNSFKGQVMWKKDNIRSDFLDGFTNIVQINDTYLNITLKLTEIHKRENGTYTCIVPLSHNGDIREKEIILLVMDVPQVTIDYVKAIGADKIFLNWTVNDGNDPIQKYFVQYMPDGVPPFIYYNHAISGKNTSYVLENFSPNTSYLLRMSAKNSIGNGAHHQYNQPVRTLSEDPIFIPKVETTGSTSSTITIGWSPPRSELLEYIQYYELVVSANEDNTSIIEEAVYQQNSRNLPYMFDNLKTATDYRFKVRSCSDLTKLCGPWSDIVNGTTLDGIPSKPTELNITCLAHNETRLNSIIVTWNLPRTPNGKVVSYLINIEGKSSYKRDGRLHDELWGPKIRRIDEPHHKTVYEGVLPNTNYTVAISAVTRHRKPGYPATGNCRMPISIPDTINRIVWTKMRTSDNKCIFKIFMPRISERNGPICCYLVYLVRMSNKTMELPNPQDLNVSTYRVVHSANNSEGGAYIAEIFSGDNFKSEIYIGDSKRIYYTHYNKTDSIIDDCTQCFGDFSLLRKSFEHYYEKRNSGSKKAAQSHYGGYYLPGISEYNVTNKVGNLTEGASKIRENRSRTRRFSKVVVGKYILQDVAKNFSQNTILSHVKVSAINPVYYNEIFDGEIDVNSNYTGFLEVVVRDKKKILRAYSSYFDVITPETEEPYFGKVTNMYFLNIIIQALGVLTGIVLLILVPLCCFHHFNSENSAMGEELNLRTSLSSAFCGGGRSNNHGHFMGTPIMKSSDFGPIKNLDIARVYKILHKDTDYGFLREYEMLPSRFNDRTTKNSDIKDNALKNRYPDIKAYDQTRVKLSQINGSQYTDYINANYVIGYKERKKFICAQGPMENTTFDFWRMIWEQHLEIIIMLTNLEEYNKTKCAKYWPEKISDSQYYGDIVVELISEQNFGEFLIRKLEIYRRNFLNEFDEDHRHIVQYHYLAWKDFMAPEHPYDITKFIRTINVVYSVQRGPLLVHCSAGVGRTGTFVALDILMEQLKEENQVSIFNTVYDMRRQRNFLVQSMKQYVFLYRALLDSALFGNTEIPAHCITTYVDSLRKKQDMQSACPLELEFETLAAHIDETDKACICGSSEANMRKNRESSIIPFDINRVILSPLPAQENSTYINASFIDGYYYSENFIITQDPLENTISDFWRMISEQNVTTIVMMSEVGEGPKKCPRYWADDEIQCQQILVKYRNSETCPYYIRREFSVTNLKIDDTIEVIQYQYNGWPTVDGEVPEVCRGIIELVDQTQHQHLGCNSPIVAHCSFGTERSPIFVAMCILVRQIRTERKIDICTTVRKLRAKRNNILDTYAQYEFLHRAISNYADLHNISGDFLKTNE